MSKKAKTTTNQSDSRLSLGNYTVTGYLLVMFTLFPLAVNVTALEEFPFFTLADGFVAIRHVKFYLFLAATVITALALLAMLLTNTLNYGSSPKTVHPRFRDTLTFTDYAAAALFLFCVISTLTSKHFMLALLGEWTYDGTTVGRNNGLLIIFLYLAAYFMITRLYRYSEIAFTALAAACSIVYLLTVLNGFYFDPLGMLEPFRYSSQNVFMEFFSTIGNKNMLSSFICVTLPPCVCMSVHSESLPKRIIYLAASALGTMALIIGDSDSGILGVGVFLVIFLAVYIRHAERRRRYLLALSVMSGSVLLLRGFSALTGNNYKELGELSSALLFSNAVFAVFAVLVAAAALLTVFKDKLGEKMMPKAVPAAILSLLGAAVLAMLGALLYFTLIDTKTDLGSAEKLLRLNDAWGTHRGIMWLRSFKIFGEAPWYQKLFGTGPDTFYYAFQPYFAELENYGNSSTDAAHNEYLNYLITIGVFGLASYLAFVGSALFRAIRARRQNPVLMVFAAAVIAYAVQAVVNIAVPISAPLFFIFIALCEAESRKANCQL